MPIDREEYERIQGFRDRMNSVSHPRHPATHKRPESWSVEDGFIKFRPDDIEIKTSMHEPTTYTIAGKEYSKEEFFAKLYEVGFTNQSATAEMFKPKPLHMHGTVTGRMQMSEIPARQEMRWMDKEPSDYHLPVAKRQKLEAEVDRLLYNTPPIAVHTNVNYAKSDVSMAEDIMRQMRAQSLKGLAPGHYKVTEIQDSILIEPMEGQHMNRKQIAAEAEALSQRLAAMQQELGKFEAWPENDDDIPIGTIIKFSRILEDRVPAESSTPHQHIVTDTYGRPAYSSENIPAPGKRQRLRIQKTEYIYAGVKSSDEFWYITGARANKNGLDWDELLDTIVKGIHYFAYQTPGSNEWVYVVGEDESAMLESMKADEAIASTEGKARTVKIKDNPQA